MASSIGPVGAGSPIRAVGVVVPVRDEEEEVADCLVSVRRALDAVPSDVEVAVVAVLDRCRDRTPQIVADLASRWPELTAMTVAATGGRPARHRRVQGTGSGPLHLVSGTGVGAVRDLGIRHVLRELRPHEPATLWLLSTDADTTVPTDWVLAHLRYAAAGTVGVAGMADLDGFENLSPQARDRYLALMAQRTDGSRHHNVYGANLGVRADAYLAVGGFPVDGVGEEHLLWERLQANGYPMEQPTALRVRTSARTLGRAAGGLADLLDSLDEAVLVAGVETHA